MCTCLSSLCEHALLQSVSLWRKVWPHNACMVGQHREQAFDESYLGPVEAPPPSRNGHGRRGKERVNIGGGGVHVAEAT